MNPTPTDIPTPRVDAVVRTAEIQHHSGRSFHMEYTVDADFARILERENIALNKAHQREHDLVRQQRMELHEAGLITDEEYASLASEKGAVQRLESYDAITQQRDELKAEVERLKQDNKDLQNELWKAVARIELGKGEK